MPAKFVQQDLKDNHNRKIAKSFIQNTVAQVSNEIENIEENREYEIPKMNEKVETIGIGIDGTCMPMGGENWREAMCGTISFYDKEGKRMHTIYKANAPEYGKNSFKERMDREISDTIKHFPEAKIVGVADGAKENWTFLSKYTDLNILDFYHATEYLSQASKGFHPRSIPKRKIWFEKACNILKNIETGAKDLLDEIVELKNKKLSNPIQKAVNATISYFSNNLERMNYKNSIDAKLPIGSGVTESACKILVKQRVCVSGANWSEYGAKRFLPLRAICLTDGRWNQIWDRMMSDKVCI